MSDVKEEPMAGVMGGHTTTPEDSNVSPPPTVQYGNIPSKKYFFGAQGKALSRQVSFAGALGFLLFGYDQGVLGVSAPSSKCCKRLTPYAGSQRCRGVSAAVQLPICEPPRHN